MERAEGESYFTDLEGFALKDRLSEKDVDKIKAMTSYLADIHAVKKDSRTLYWRKIRDTVGHGECLMGVFDTYPDGVLTYEEMAEIVKKAVDRIARLKPKYGRLSQVHGDFHPGNIWFTRKPTVAAGVEGNGLDFILLDRSRGPWGDPADDITALTINYIFFSIKHHGHVRAAYLAGLKLFFDEYVRVSGDEEIAEIVAPFFAFRGAVVANPVFYPEITAEQRKLILRFVHNVLDDARFDHERVNEYLR
jgi:aminoglycoside phosphotransferase (APT) family kinase protein